MHLSTLLRSCHLVSESSCPRNVLSLSANRFVSETFMKRSYVIVRTEEAIYKQFVQYIRFASSSKARRFIFMHHIMTAVSITPADMQKTQLKTPELSELKRSTMQARDINVTYSEFVFTNNVQDNSQSML